MVFSTPPRHGNANPQAKSVASSGRRGHPADVRSRARRIELSEVRAMERLAAAVSDLRQHLLRRYERAELHSDYIATGAHPDHRRSGGISAKECRQYPHS